MSELEEKINSILSNPEEMSRIAQMAASFMDSGGSNDAAKGDSPDLSKLMDSVGGIDPAMLASFGKLISGSDSGLDKNGLLNAMKPYLSEKRKTKMDKAIQIAKMARVAKIAFADYGGTDDGL